jgi:chromosome segregation ATPase
MKDIVERLRVKWDSMGDMANAERDEAAYAIICLRNECAMEVAHTKEIRQQVTDLRALLAEALAQRDEAKSKIERIMSGLEGCCMTCEPVGVRNQQMQRDIKTMQDQRDEARREVCAWQGATSGKSFRDTAVLRGWDCFKDEHGRSS